MATNKGLVLIDEGEIFEFDNSDGVIDIDFNYQGIFPLNRQKFILVGDQLSYLIDTHRVKAFVERRRNHQAQASIFKVRVLPEAGTEAMLSPHGEIELKSSPEEIIFEFASADYLYSHLHKLEYRLMGFHEEWQSLPDNMGTVAYSGLDFGQFDFQVRVVDSKSKVTQPVSRYPFSIATPFWYTWQAYILYLVAVGLAIWLVILLIKRHLALKSLMLAEIIQQKQSALMESNRSITELLNKKERIFSNLAAEIKQPVMQIINPLAELRNDHLTSKMRQKLDAVYSHAGRLRVLMDQLTAVQRIEHISSQILQSYSVGKTLDYLVETLRPQAIQKQQILSYECQIKSRVLLVQDSLEAMVNNLLLNAITFTQPRGTIRVKASADADRMHIRVSDNGPGMSQEELEFVISRFAHGANHNGKSGIGIGLNLTNELVLANEGWLEIKSQKDSGTEVTLHLPLNTAVDATEAENGAESETIIRQVADKRASYETNELPVVLVIERSQEASEYLIDLVGQRYNCYALQSGAKALEIIPVLRPDIIISELNVPDMSGIAFTEKLREEAEFADLPVMILTATSDHTAKLDSFKATVNDYLIKPVEREELVSRIESNLTFSRLAHLRRSDAPEQAHSENVPAYVKTILPHCSNEKERKFVMKFLSIVEANYKDEHFSRSAAALRLAISERQLNRLLSKLLPDNFTMFLKKYRLEKSMPMLASGLQITQIALEVGFGSAAYYSRSFKQVYGCLPSEMSFTQAEQVVEEES
ncbi:hypothetical protein GCM10011338_12940 [Alteromonas lipolytica]|uniref:histidine kinase n=1 Tax=Alteromonas lipolytica TaxID=1856405 RepID=A0A1E8FB81_9ALTE|nr:hypothetical protein BFC17_02555 [Alteromonas lipolytica]GGF61986.1 hypothetical protein GCM10011338_12940 [Alteromonas lipolytica]